MIFVEFTKKTFVELCEYISDKAKADQAVVSGSYYSAEDKTDAKKNLELAKGFLNTLLAEDGAE